MKKTGVLLFVIVLVATLFGCKKKNSPDESFKILVGEIEKDLGIVFLEKNENKFFLPIELLEKDTLSNLIDGVQTRLNDRLLFSSDDLNESNNSLKQVINLYSYFNRQFLENGVIIDSMEVFSIISVLSMELGKKGISPEEQFSQIIFRLEEIPIYFSKAKELIKKPTKPKLINAIKQYSNDYFYLKNKLSLFIRKPDILKDDQIDFSRKNEKAQLAVKDFIAFLNSQIFELDDK